jgi:hypothetical protein
MPAPRQVPGWSLAPASTPFTILHLRQYVTAI